MDQESWLMYRSGKEVGDKTDKLEEKMETREKGSQVTEWFYMKEIEMGSGYITETKEPYSSLQVNRVSLQVNL